MIFILAHSPSSPPTSFPLSPWISIHNRARLAVLIHLNPPISTFTSHFFRLMPQRHKSSLPLNLATLSIQVNLINIVYPLESKVHLFHLFSPFIFPYSYISPNVPPSPLILICFPFLLVKSAYSTTFVYIQIYVQQFTHYLHLAYTKVVITLNNAKKNCKSNNVF